LNKEVKETAVKAITKKTVTNTKRETVMYIGPTVRGVVINGTLFKDGKLPALVKKRTEEMPVLQSLFVPVSKLAEAQRELKDLKSAMAICYSKAVEALTEKED
jgi:hypothetical protein